MLYLDIYLQYLHAKPVTFECVEKQVETTPDGSLVLEILQLFDDVLRAHLRLVAARSYKNRLLIRTYS